MTSTSRRCARRPNSAPRWKGSQGRKFIFTNGSRAHAERVAAKLGVLHHFELFANHGAGTLIERD